MPGPALRRRSLPLLAVLALAAVPASAHATTQFGQVNPGTSGTVCGASADEQSVLFGDPNTAAPTGGTITSLETFTHTFGDNGQFMVLRPTGAPATYKIAAAGPSFSETTLGLKSFATKIVIHRGDFLGILFDKGTQNPTAPNRWATTCNAFPTPGVTLPAEGNPSTTAPGTIITLAPSGIHSAINARATLKSAREMLQEIAAAYGPGLGGTLAGAALQVYDVAPWLRCSVLGQARLLEGLLPAIAGMTPAQAHAYTGAVDDVYEALDCDNVTTATPADPPPASARARRAVARAKATVRRATARARRH